MDVTVGMIKELRDKTNAGMMDCKKALSEVSGDMKKAADWLRQKGLVVASKRGGREIREGQISSYIHAGGKLGVIVEVNCETDFTGKTDEFKNFAHDLAMHIAAVNPLCISLEDVPKEILEREKNIYMAQAKDQKKPEKIVEKIVEGKLRKFYKQVCLLEQSFVKDPDSTISDLLNDLRAKTGENIKISRFIRYQLGEKD